MNSKKKGGRFRSKRVNFSMVSNEILRDSSISLKAKGLYSVIQSFITLDDFTLYKGYLQSICIEGEKAFDSAWKELKEKGYLIQHKMREGAKNFYYEYELLDSPLDPQNVGVENVGVENVGVENVGVENVGLQNVGGTKGGCINNTILNNTISNHILSNHIISEADVMEQIEYEPYMKDTFIENIVLIMMEILNMPNEATVRVNQLELPAELVKERFRKIRYKHIEYVKLVLQEFTGEISSMKNYLITAIYNAPATCDIYFDHRVKCDMLKESSQYLA